MRLDIGSKTTRKRLIRRYLDVMAKKKNVLTAEQREARNKRRAEARVESRKRTKEIVAAAQASGKMPAGPARKLIGRGDYAPRTRVLRGRGDFADSLASIAGDGIRKGVSWVSNKALGFLSGLFGSGDYATPSAHPNQNNLWTGAAVPTQVHSTADRAYVFRGREQIANIYSSDAAEGVQQTFDVNPGLSQFMEWLSIMAPGFSEWYPNGLVFEYVPAVSPQAPNSSGKLAMCVSYDNGEPDPENFKQMSQFQMSVQMPPYQAGLMAGECAPKATALNWYKVRTGDVPITDDAHSIYDWGKLHVRCGGQTTAGTLVGTVFVIYEIVFQKPLAPRQVGRTLTDVYTMTAASNSAYFGTARTARTGNTLGVTFPTNNSILFPSWLNTGKFLISLGYNGTSATAATPTVTLSNCSSLNWFSGGFGFEMAPAAGAAGTSLSYDFAVEITASGASITFSSGTIPTNASGTIMITVLDSDITIANRARVHYEQHWKKLDEQKADEMRYIQTMFANYVADKDTNFLAPPPCYNEDSDDEKSVVEVKQPHFKRAK